MIAWPNSLIREVAARRCIFFLGAGVSASAMAPGGRRLKNWQEFLQAARDLIADNTERQIVDRLIQERKYLLALQMIRDATDPGNYRTLLDEEFNNPAVQPSDLHKCIFELDARIVITTNFDRIYERHCFQVADREAFKVLPYYTTSIADELRSDTRIIIKAHGSIDDIGKMIFTRSEYHKAKAVHAHFYEILKALFLTNTVLFIGCGFNDPDVALLLEEVKIVGQGELTHFALFLAGTEDKPTLADWRKTYNVNCLEYAPDHAALLEDLRNLGTLVEEARALRS